jgi:hypothetical protein
VFPEEIDLSLASAGDAIEKFESPSDWRFNDLDALSGLRRASS